MREKEKILVTNEGRLDLDSFTWDDQVFTDILVRDNPINSDQALGISRFLRDEISKMEPQTITLSLIEQMIEDKLMEYGLTKPTRVQLDKSIFLKKGLALSENAVTVLKRRYLRKDSQGKVIETPEKMFRRVAQHIAKAEKNYGADDERVKVVEETFYDLMTQVVFLPNSPTLMNAGRRLGQLAACFVLPVEDSMEGIFGALRNAAMIHKSGGGTGFSFSRLRPKDSNVGTTGGVASGPVSFMKIFNTATEQVKQGGTRRGANMAILRVDHPDVVEFIHSKSNDRELNNFNISVGVTDAFMEAAAAQKEYDLLDPRDKQPTGRLNAAEVYEALVTQAWKTGDPGIIFLDRMNADNPTPALGEIESTNPCVAGDSWAMTAEGPRRVRDLLDRRVPLAIKGKTHPSSDKGFFCTGKKPVYTLKTRAGFELRLTGDHRVLRAASVARDKVMTEWVQAAELVPGDRIVLNDCRTLTGWLGTYGKAEGYLVGLLIGDGTLKQDKAVLSVWPQSEAVNGGTGPHSGVMETAFALAKTLPHRSDFRGWMAVPGRGEYRMSLGALKAICGALGMSPGHKRITPTAEECSSEFYRGLLGGLFDSDGSVQGTQAKGVSVRLSQSDMPTLQAVQRMLLRLGIASAIYENRRGAGETILPDGRGGSQAYATKPQHELVISGDNLLRFREIIDFRDENKAARLQTLLASYKRSLNRERFLAEFVALIPDGEKEVFDVQVPGVNCFDANGFVVHNCGEQPLLPMEACNLGSVNLAKFVVESASGPAVDYPRLKEAISWSVRFLDNTIDMSRYPLPEITEMVRGNRKIGLGVMGFADMLFQMGIPYNSEEALQAAEEVMHFIQEACHETSEALAQERGVFANWERSIFKDQGLQRRNATTTTIAPTGTLSIIAGCSSGIEPLFALSFVRTVMDNDKLMEVNPVFEKAARERGFYRPELMDQVARKGSIHEIEEIPEDVRRVFVTAHDVSSEWHIRMQAAFQKHTDNAVSKTVNLPRDATVEDVRKVYDLAYQLRCKGVTIYRDGSKENQVLSFGQRKEEAERLMGAVLDRPETLFGFTTKTKTGYGHLYVTVTEFEGRPFEVFATIGKSGRSTTAKTEAIGRLVSLALRAGVTVDKIVDQLKGIGGEHPIFQDGGLVLSIPDAIARVLEKRYMTGDNAPMFRKTEYSLLGEKCPECGQVVSFEEGCMICHFCGFNKCG
jgi:ribonucleoside-diphosphate reductase alpha chain